MMFSFLTGWKLKALEIGAAALALLAAVARIFYKGKAAGEAKVQAEAAREQAETVATAREVHEQAASQSDHQIGVDLNTKYGDR